MDQKFVVGLLLWGYSTGGIQCINLTKLVNIIDIPIPRKLPLQTPVSLTVKWYPTTYPKENVLRTYSQSVRAKTKDLP